MQHTPDGPRRVSLEGCSPRPLAGYLKALGVFRLLAEQCCPSMRGYWDSERFVLTDAPPADEILRFFLEDYRPSPILSPWNKDARFFSKNPRSSLIHLEKATADRFQPIVEVIQAVRALAAEMGLGVGEDVDMKERKDEFLRRLRANLPDSAVPWLDATFVLTEDSQSYSPIFGTGGVDGRMEFASNFLDRIVDLFDPSTGKARDACRPLLLTSLFGRAAPGLQAAAVGQFAPAAAGGANASTSFEGESRVNPWDYVFMMEGALFFAAAATRRLESGSAARISAPFTVRATAAGTGAMELKDETKGRGEIWAPLWGRPASLREVRSLFHEGRATLGRRAAVDGLDFARAAARLGVTRGVTEFQRYALVPRFGKSYLAVALERVPVRRNPRADLIDELENMGWLEAFRRFSRSGGGGSNKPPARLLGLRRRLDDALFDLSVYGRDSALAVQEVLIVLGNIMRYFATSAKAREACRPIPWLDRQWVRAADDGSAEFRIAAALAGLNGRRPVNTDEGLVPYPMCSHIAPMTCGSPREWLTEDTSDVVWSAGSLEDNLARTIYRRLISAGGGSSEVDRPLEATHKVPLSYVAQWLGDEIDEKKIHDLFLGLCLVRPTPFLPHNAVLDGSWALVPSVYRLLKPLFCTNQQLHELSLLSKDTILHLPLDLIRLLRTGNTQQALNLAARILRPAGFRFPKHLSGAFPKSKRLLAALLVPITDFDLRLLVEPFRRPIESISSTSNQEESHVH